MSAFTDAMSRYGAVTAGLAIGTAAKYGLSINDGKPVTWRGVVADLLLLGLLGLIAVMFSDWANLTGNSKVLAGAIAAVSSDRLIRLIRKKFEDRVSAAIDAHIPGPSTPPPDQSEATARLWAGEVSPPPEDMLEQLRRLDEPSDHGIKP